MKTKIGNMLENYFLYDGVHSVCIVTGNSFIKKNGELVMGRGAAKSLAFIRPDLPKKFGEIIQRQRDRGIKEYYLIMVGAFGLFQVKYGWWEEAKLNLIETSCAKLISLALTNPNCEFNINYPGIGNGGLREEDVFGYIKEFPDNVTVWKFK